jgi:hypothetical protein
VANYCRVVRLLKDADGRVVGARIRDVGGGGGTSGGGEEFDVRARVGGFTS